MNNLRLWANYYYNMGFNVTHINAKLNHKAKNPYKSATNNRFALRNKRQEVSELNSLDWENSDGIGVVLGFNNLRAIDFDFHRWSIEVNHDKRDEFISICLDTMNLPKSYEWVISTPKGGFHILFYSRWHNIPVKENLTKAFTPNVKYYDKYNTSYFHFKQIELRWEKHLVLPPSLSKNVVHKETESWSYEEPIEQFSNYEFLNKKLPISNPLEVETKSIHKLLNEICYDDYGKEGSYINSKKSGYNIHLSGYYDSQEEGSIQFYIEGEFLDFSPLYFKLDEQSSIPEDWIK